MMSGMATLSDHYNESKKYSATIMNDIKSILEKKKLSYEEKPNGSELIIQNTKKKKDDILKLIKKELDIPDYIISILIKIGEVNNTIYIRQNTK